MNATGESDRAFFYDRVSALQHYLTPAVEHLLRLIMLSLDGPTEGKEPDVWSIEWKPLWAPSEKEQADTRKVNMDAITAAVDKVIITTEEARASLKSDPFFVLDDAAWEAQDVDLSDLMPGASPLALPPGAADPGDKDIAAAGANESPDTESTPPRDPIATGRKVPVIAHSRTIRPKSPPNGAG